MIINIGLIIKRDKISFAAKFLNPFKGIGYFKAVDYAVECLCRFYWKPINDSIIAKKIVNVLNVAFGILILLGILVHFFVFE